MSRLTGLYAITPEHSGAPGALAEQVAQAIAGGARMVQYRDKSSDTGKRLDEARRLLSLCRAASIPLIINDDLDLAERIGADGIHLGRHDPDPREARNRLGSDAIVGLSCYDQLQRGIHAQEVGADYAAFGSFYPSATKPRAAQATPRLLIEACKRLAIPPIAIGGITPENGLSLVRAGARMLAVVEAVFGQPDIRAAAAAFSALFQHGDCDP